MAHVREQIRQAAKTALTGLALTGSNVFASHTYPVGQDQLPAITVDTGDEASETVSVTSSGTRLRRELELVVCVYVRANAGYDATVDAILADVEAALQTDATLAALVKLLHPASLETDYSGEGAARIAVARQLFYVEYHTLSTDAETAI